MVFDGMDSGCDGSLTMKVYAASERRGNTIKLMGTFTFQQFYM
jgi:hypothetical protein